MLYSWLRYHCGLLDRSQKALIEKAYFEDTVCQARGQWLHIPSIRETLQISGSSNSRVVSGKGADERDMDRCCEC